LLPAASIIIWIDTCDEQEQRVSTPRLPTNAAPSATSRSFVIAAAAIAGMFLAGTLAMWAYWGTAVFHEMVLAGIAACL
jgi:hypothetical protein